VPHLTLPDGRELELRVAGPDDGPVIVFHHGTPGSSHPLPAHVRAAAERGHRFVTTARADERPTFARIIRAHLGVDTHDLPLVRDLCPRTVIMDGGHVVGDGPSASILDDEFLLSAHGLEKM